MGMLQPMYLGQGFNPMMMGWRMPMMGWPQVVPQQQNAPVESTDETLGHVQPGDGGPVELNTEETLPSASTETPVPPNPLLEPGQVPTYMTEAIYGGATVPGEVPVVAPTMPDGVHEGGPTLPAEVPVVESAVPPSEPHPGPPRSDDSDESEYVEEEQENWNETTDERSTRGCNQWQYSWRESTDWNERDGWEEMEMWYDVADDGGEGMQTGRPLTVFSQPGEPEPEPKRILPKKRPRPPAENPPEHLLCRAFLQAHVVPPPKAMPSRPMVIPLTFPESTSSGSSSVSGGIRHTWSVRKMPPPKQ